MTLETNMGEFLDNLASAQPTPGGGGAAALAGAMAAALNSMVCNLTIGKKKYQSVSEEMKTVLAESESIRKRFSELIDEDAKAFDNLMSAFRLPKETEEEKKKRSVTIQETTRTAALVPLEMIKLCVKLVPYINITAERGNINVVSDAGVAMLCIGSAAQSAALNVNINLMGISDRKWAKEIFDDMNKMLSQIRLGNEVVLKTVAEKMGS